MRPQGDTKDGSRITLIFRAEVPTKLLALSVPWRLFVLAREKRIQADEAFILLAFLFGKKIWSFFEYPNTYDIASNTLRNIASHTDPWYEIFNAMPSKVQETLLNNFRSFESFWKRYEKDILDILYSIHRGGPSVTVDVYPIPPFFGITSNLLHKDNIILLGIPLVQELKKRHLLELTKVLVHELAHLYFLYSDEARRWSTIYFGAIGGAEEHAKRVTKYVMTKMIEKYQ